MTRRERKAQAERVKAGTALAFNHGELAELWYAARGEDWAYVPEAKIWRRWEDGGGWLLDAHGRIKLSMLSIARTTWRKMTKDGPIPDREKEGSHATVTGSVNLASAMRAVPIADWDADPYLLGLPGGKVLALGTGKDGGGWAIRDQMRSDLLVHRLAVEPAARLDPEHPTIQWLTQKLPEEDARHFVIKFLGYLLDGRAQEQAALWMVGQTLTGKSTFQRMCGALFGDYAFSVHHEYFENSGCSRESPRGYALARGVGKRLLLVAEWREGGELDADFFNAITGNDTLFVRQIYAKPFEYSPAYKPFFASNHPPAGGLTPPVLRRIGWVEMLESHARKIDVTMAARLLQPDSLAQLAALALQGWQAWRREGLRPFPYHEIELPRDANPVKSLIDDCVANGVLVARGKMRKHELATVLLASNSNTDVRLRDIQTGIRKYCQMRADSSGKRWIVGLSAAKMGG